MNKTIKFDVNQMNLLIKTVINSLNVEDFNILLNRNLLIEWKKNNPSFEINFILAYIEVFGFNKFQNKIVNIYKDKKDNPFIIFTSDIVPLFCDNEYKAHFLTMRKKAYTDYLTDNNKFKFILKREPHNPYDSNAIAVYAGIRNKYHVGYISKYIARDISHLIDNNVKYYIVANNKNINPESYPKVSICFFIGNKKYEEIKFKKEVIFNE